MGDTEFQHFTTTRTQNLTRLQGASFGIFEITIVVAMAVFFILLIVIICYLRKMKEKHLSKLETISFFKGGDVKGMRSATDCINSPYNKSKYELSKRCFTIEETSPLGSGEFGKVCRGTITRTVGEVENVAVKMTNVPSTREALRGLMFEIKILSFLEKHPYIVELKGAYTAELNKGRAFVFLELCEMGSLQHYLRELKCQLADGPIEATHDSGSYVDIQSNWTGVHLEESDVNDLFRWSQEIASGMKFIASKNIVHLDLATRNVLLTFDKRAKITDFGLSRRVYDFLAYIKKEQVPLPWRWMPPESLRCYKFTEKSDVWAFGVTLWEMFELGGEPYPGLSWDVNFPNKLERGLRLGEPTYNLRNIYAVMTGCWTTNPEGRPTFAELSNALTVPSLLDQSNAGNTTVITDNPDIAIETSIEQFQALEALTCEISSEENANHPTYLDRFKELLSHIKWEFVVESTVFLVVILTLVILTEEETFIKPIPDCANGTYNGLENPLHVAAASNASLSISIIKCLIQNGENVNRTDKKGQTFLHILLRDGNDIQLNQFQDMAEYLASKNLLYLFNIQENSDGITSLMLAARNVELDLAMILLLHINGVDLTLADKNGSSYLSYAAEGSKNRQLLTDLARYGNIKHSKLIPAIVDMDGDSVKVLVRLGADVNEKDNKTSWKTPLLVAAEKKNMLFAINIIKFLIESGADVDAREENNFTFLHRLLFDGTTITPKQFHELATFLISKGLSRLFNTPYTNGGTNTPFHFAVAEVEIDRETLSLLKNNDVNFNAVGGTGSSILYHATFYNHTLRLISDLVDLGANPKQLRTDNITMLHLAARICRADLAKFFLEKGVDVNARTDRGSTPLHFALDSPYRTKVFKVVQILRKHGAKSDIVNKDGQNARDIFNKNRGSYTDEDKISGCLAPDGLANIVDSWRLVSKSDFGIFNCWAS